MGNVGPNCGVGVGACAHALLNPLLNFSYAICVQKGVEKVYLIGARYSYSIHVICFLTPNYREDFSLIMSKKNKHNDICHHATAQSPLNSELT